MESQQIATPKGLAPEKAPAYEKAVRIIQEMSFGRKTNPKLANPKTVRIKSAECRTDSGSSASLTRMEPNGVCVNFIVLADDAPSHLIDRETIQGHKIVSVTCLFEGSGGRMILIDGNDSHAWERFASDEVEKCGQRAAEIIASY